MTGRLAVGKESDKKHQSETTAAQMQTWFLVVHAD